MSELLHEHEHPVTLGVLENIREELVAIKAQLRRADEWGAIDAIQRLSWAAGGSADFNERGSFRSVVVLNENDFAITVGLAPGAGARGGQAETFTLQPRGYVVLPARGVTISVGAAAAGSATVMPLSTTMPFVAGSLGVFGSAAASPGFADVTDRLARALGRVSVGVADSLGSAGAVTAPGALTTLAAITPPAGVYLVRLFLRLFGPIAVGDIGNGRFRVNGASNISSLPDGAELVVDRVTLAGGQPIDIINIAAGTAGVVYNARITATRIE